MKKGAISIVSAVMGAIGGMITVAKKAEREISTHRATSEKHFELFLMMNQWVKVKQEGENLSSYFRKNNYKRIAIYGLSYAGETLLEELKDSEIEVAYAIDRNADTIYSDIKVVSMDDALEDVDAIVVTAISYFDAIADELRRKKDCPILSLYTILYEV